jgi:ferric-dicitrate binding protein FerR (iron transport regulator)
MEENNDNTIFGIEKGDILKYALYAEAGLIAYGGVIAMGLEAPKYAHATTHAATTVQADALLPDGSYSVLNAMQLRSELRQTTRPSSRRISSPIC